MTPPPTPSGPFTAALDVGGTGIKAMLLDGTGKPVTERTRVPTPRPATVEAVLPILGRLVEELGQVDRVAVGFPGVVVEGRVTTAANMDPTWVGFDLETALQALVNKPVRVANDADVQGLAVVEGKGVELMITLGTGVGSGLYLDGRLVPNLELGHHPFRKGETYEQQLADSTLEKIGKKKWLRRLERAVDAMLFVFNPRKLYIGGGNSRHIDIDDLPKDRVKIVDNVAGLLGCHYLWK